MAKVLLVEDDVELQDTIREWLQHEYHMVDAVQSGQDALALLESYKYDLLLLDWEIPDIKGPELCRRYRANGGTAPVLFVTARKELIDKEIGFDVGADDYIVKPFHLKELSMRIRALLRRAPHFAGDKLTAGNIEIHLAQHVVKVNGETVKLAPIEFAMLEFFVRNPNQVFSAQALLERVWPATSERSPETFRTCLKRLRDKISPVPDQPSPIVNVHGVGYKLEIPGNE